jgi:hypothetical protein
LLDEFWNAEEYLDGQFQSEVERFAGFLQRRIADGAVSSPFAAELLEFELALNTLKFLPRQDLLRQIAGLPLPEPDTPCRLHPLARIVLFRHDPTALFAAARHAGPWPDVPRRDAVMALSLVHGAPSLTRLPVQACCRRADGSRQIAGPLTPRLAPELAEAGLLVPSSNATRAGG